MTIYETCTCGAEFRYASGSIVDIRGAQLAFHEAHKECRKPTHSQGETE